MILIITVIVLLKEKCMLYRRRAWEYVQVTDSTYWRINQATEKEVVKTYTAPFTKFSKAPATNRRTWEAILRPDLHYTFVSSNVLLRVFKVSLHIL